MIHSPGCQKEIDAQKKATEDWLTKWPDHCDNCRGWGGWSWPGSYWEPPDFEECLECTGKGLCGRCMKPLGNEDGEGPCPSCGWNCDDGVPEDWVFCAGECMIPDPDDQEIIELN